MTQPVIDLSQRVAELRADIAVAKLNADNLKVAQQMALIPPAGPAGLAQHVALVAAAQKAVTK